MKMAELPKDEPFGKLGFSIFDKGGRWSIKG
jgi:hypothetical protein